jgi:hypothetical protein
MDTGPKIAQVASLVGELALAFERGNPVQMSACGTTLPSDPLEPTTARRRKADLTPQMTYGCVVRGPEIGLPLMSG